MAEPSDNGLRAFVREVAIAARTIVRAHPGCGAVADLACVLQSAPIAVPEVEVRPHLEDAKDEAYAEVRRLTAEVARLRAELAEPRQQSLFGSAEVDRG